MCPSSENIHLHSIILRMLIRHSILLRRLSLHRSFWFMSRRWMFCLHHFSTCMRRISKKYSMRICLKLIHSTSIWSKRSKWSAGLFFNKLICTSARLPTKRKTQRIKLFLRGTMWVFSSREWSVSRMRIICRNF